MSSYRVAVITRTYPPKGGGISAAHFHLAKCLSQNHQVNVFAFDDENRSPDPNVYRAKTPGWLAGLMKWLARTWLRRYAKKQSATCCEQIFRITPAVRSLNGQLRLFCPDFILCPDNFLPALALRKPAKSKLIWVAHHNYRRFEGHPIASRHSWIDIQMAHRLERRALKKADAIVAVSDYMAGVTRETLEPSQPVCVIRNYLDTAQIAKIQQTKLREILKISENVPIVHLPSAGTVEKGERYCYELIRRLGAAGKVAFFISGAISKALQFELESLSSKIRIHMPGNQTMERNLEDVAACDLTVSPTLVENLSSALIESLALGVPVVTWDVGGNKEMIKPGINGHIAPYLDIERLIETARELIENPQKLRQMQLNSRTSITDILEPNRVLTEYQRLFDQCRINDQSFN